ncbi:MAG: hypothetical protein ACP5KA_07605, partial [Desulfurococcaceae archaeon]
GDYQIGNISLTDVTTGETHYYSVVIGPIPFDITADYKWIKVYDGIATQVAVSAETLVILPSFTLSPTWGPGCTTVTLRGAALRANVDVEIYEDGRFVATVNTGPYGNFTYSWKITDLRRSWRGTGAIPSDNITVSVVYADTRELLYAANFTEYRRSFVEVRSVVYGDAPLRFVDYYTGAGNDTITVTAYKGDWLVIAGAWWSPCEPVEIYVGGALLANVTPEPRYGFFNVTVKLPPLPPETVPLYVKQGNIVYVLYINTVLRPAIWLSPREGEVGTYVSVRGEEFPPNSSVEIYWVGCRGATLVATATTDANGTFRATFA